MSSLNRKLTVTQLLTHISILLIIVVLTIVFSPENLESRFIGQWYVASSIIFYLQYFIPISATAFMLTFSVQASPEDMGSGQPFFKLIQGALVFLLISMVVYTLLILLLLPWAYQQQADARFRSDYVSLRIERAGDSIDAREWDMAQEMIDDVLALAPRHTRATELFWELQDLRPPTPAPAPADNPSPRLPLNLSYGEILDRAERFFAEEDWYSAVFYARIALGPQDERNEPIARRILSESLKAISRLEPNAEDNRSRMIFDLKREAVQAWNARRFLDAYYTFKELEQIDPTDSDLVTYLEFLTPEVETVAFFLDEIADANQEDIRRNVFFKLPEVFSSRHDGASLAGPGIRRFIAAEQMMYGLRGLYFINMEYIEVRPDGGVLQHIVIPRGKMSGSYLITRAIDRDRQDLRYQADYVVGQAPSGEEGVLQMNMDSSEIWAVNPSTPFFNDVNILQLFSLARIYPDYGRDPLFPQSEILYRLLLPFSLINVSLIIIGMGWKGRSRYLSGPPLYLYIFLPLIPLFILALFDLYIFVFRNLLSAVLILSSFPIALVTLAAIQAFTFIAIMIGLARLSAE